MPQRRPTIDPRSADRPSPLSAPPTTASGGESESPRSASASRFEPLQAFPRVFGRGQADRSVSAKADLSSTRNATPVASPIKDEDDSGPKRGLKGFFTRARSKSDARPPVDRAALRQPEQPPVPSSASSHNLQEASARPSMSSITRPSVAALDTRANLPPLPPPLEQPSSAASVDSSQQSPVVRTPQSAHTALPTAIQGGKWSVASPAQRSVSQTSGPPRREEPTLAAPARRPSQQATSPASAAIGDRATPRSILKSPRSPAAVRNSPSSPEATPLKVPASQRHFADLMQQDAKTAEVCCLALPSLATLTDIDIEYPIAAVLTVKPDHDAPVGEDRACTLAARAASTIEPAAATEPRFPSKPTAPAKPAVSAGEPAAPAAALASVGRRRHTKGQRTDAPAGTPAIRPPSRGRRLRLPPGSGSASPDQTAAPVARRHPSGRAEARESRDDTACRNGPADDRSFEQRAVLAGPSPAPALKDKKTRKLFRAGLPPSIRGEVWMFFSGATERREVGQWPKLLAEAEATDEMAKDVEACVA